MARNSFGVEFMSGAEMDAEFENRGIEIPAHIKNPPARPQIEQRAAERRWLAAAMARAEEAGREIYSVRDGEPRLVRSQRIFN